MSTPVLLLYRIGIVAYFGAELIVEGLKPSAPIHHDDLALLCIMMSSLPSYAPSPPG